jgi:hypothetical protein
VSTTSSRAAREDGRRGEAERSCRSRSHGPVATLGGVKWRFLALAAASVGAVASAAESAVRVETTAPPPVVTVKVMITDGRISVSPKRAQRGTMARFVLLNLGKKAHTFRLGHQRYGTATQTGFTKALKPGEQSIHIFFLDYRGRLPYTAPLPADRSKPAMRGVFTIF